MRQIIFPLSLFIVTISAVMAVKNQLNVDAVMLAMTIGTIATSYLSELAFPYRKNVEVGTMKRDVLYIFINLTFLAVAGALTIRGTNALAQLLVGQNKLFQSSQLGPAALQFVVALFLLEGLRYLVHRLQHRSDFLWKFHAQHHSVRKLYSLNTYYSHPLDLYLRHGLSTYVVLMIGFEPVPLIAAVAFLGVIGILSHCGADLKYGFLNEFLTTGQVHRWHHSTQFGAIGKNYAPSLILIDRIFGTYYFEKDNPGPEEMGLGQDAAAFPVANAWKFTWQPFAKENAH